MTTAQLGALALLTWICAGALALLWLRQRRLPRVRHYVTQAQDVAQAVYVQELPASVRRLREEHVFARRLLQRHYTGRATSRRACMGDGALSDRQWRRAHSALHAAGLLHNGARTHRTGAEAQNVLDRYYETHETLAWRSAGFVTPR